MAENIQQVDGTWMNANYPNLDPTMPEFVKARDREQAKRNATANKKNGTSSKKVESKFNAPKNNAMKNAMTQNKQKNQNIDKIELQRKYDDERRKNMSGGLGSMLMSAFKQTDMQEKEGYEIIHVLPLWAYTDEEFAELIDSIDFVYNKVLYKEIVLEPDDITINVLLDI